MKLYVELRIQDRKFTAVFHNIVSINLALIRFWAYLASKYGEDFVKEAKAKGFLFYREIE